MAGKRRRLIIISRKFMESCSVNLMLPTIFFLYAFFLCPSLPKYCNARDTITFNDSISDERGDTLVSAEEIFVLGFFTPNESSSDARYVGIWYYRLGPEKAVVWVANRDNPLSDRSGVFAITEDGNLHVLNSEKNSHWSTNVQSSSSKKRTAKLTKFGNLVLSNSTTSTLSLWDSFHNPTDTFLPGMLMDKTLQLTSWKNNDDPATGDFTFQRVNEDEVGNDQFNITRNRLLPYWRSGESSEFNSSKSNQMPNGIASLLSNFSGFCSRNSYRTCFPPRINTEYGFTRLVIRFTGEIEYLSLMASVDEKEWDLGWHEPRDRCSVLNACGNFSSCNSNNGLMMCKCLPGFKPSSPDTWNSGDFSGGCIRESGICGKWKSNTDTFLSLKMMKVKKPDYSLRTPDETECKRQCLDNCKCQAYSYYGNTNGTSVCSIWINYLSNLQEEYDVSGSLFVRVNVSDIESTVRDCETCGTNMIPYPLSTGPKCGDPTYQSFNCNISTGQVFFEAPAGIYRVTSINPKEQKFFIQDNYAENCEAGNSLGKILQLNKSMPFHVNKSYCIANPGNFSSDLPPVGRYEVELDWDPPPEPTCTSSIDCHGWPDSSCNVASDGKKRCLCNANFQWNTSTLYCIQEGHSGRTITVSLVIAVISTAVIVLIAISCIIVYCFYPWRRRVAERQENRENIQRNQAPHLYGSERQVKDLIDSSKFREEDKKDIDVPFFDFESILVATNNFSNANKLGRGGFGLVYKGLLPGGREIAVKRLSSVSGQGLEEFKNEVILIAKLQHRNLVRLLGYCVKGEEKILVYEYMPNKSLDSFIFDQKLCVVLDWELRFNIILGIARGLLYLHQDSRLRIIHRDLKTSNVLLDEEMNPKISDFGLARIFGGKQTEASTNRVVGTYGYMSPEYANYGFFSIKSDVFSFGVVILEIISGKKITGFYQSQQALSLLGYAWRLWNEDKALDLMDQTLIESCNTNEFLKCVNVGLLCVQEDPSDRPTMSNVVLMLGSETLSLPTPKQPAFIVRNDPSSIASSSSKPETWSNNELTVTVEDGR